MFSFFELWGNGNVWSPGKGDLGNRSVMSLLVRTLQSSFSLSKKMVSIVCFSMIYLFVTPRAYYIIIFFTLIIL